MKGERDTGKGEGRRIAKTKLLRSAAVILDYPYGLEAHFPHSRPDPVRTHSPKE